MFKDKLRKLREDKGLTQQELANLLFVTRSAVAKWEQGRGIPNPDSLDAITDFFAIEKKELLSEQDAMEVIYTIQNASISERKQNMILISILSILLIVLASATALPRFLSKERYYENQFFTQAQLDYFSLSNLKEIEHSGKHLTSSMDSYYAILDDDIDIEEYANYIFEYLQNSPHISFVGFDIERTTMKYEETNKVYIAPSNHINDYKQGLFRYEFYYIDFLESNRDLQSPIPFKSISISSTNGVSYYIKNESYNFSMHLRDTVSNSSKEYYLLDEIYDFNIINVTTDNITDYFDIEIMTDEYIKEYFIVVFRYKQYFVHANIEFDIVIGYEDQVFEEHQVIKKGYDWSTYIFIYENIMGWDEEKIEIISYEVSHGDLWISE